MNKNEGVVITGGQQTVGQIVAGRNARGYMRDGGAEHHIRAQQDLSAQMEELIRLLQAERNRLPEADDLAGDAKRVAAEIAKPEPNKGKISALLQVLEEGTKNLASVASVVGSVKTLAMGLLG